MNDRELKQNILEQLEYEPGIEAADIGVTVENGTVTLSGHVQSYPQKKRAEDAVMRVRGVKAIAQEIEVRIPGTHLTADDEIAKRVLEHLSWDASVPTDALQIKVENGWVTLAGKVHWHFERDAAEKAVQNLSGVRGILNSIELSPAVEADDVRQRIERALKRDAELEAQQIDVSVADRTVILSGQVRTWAERNAAERAAWAAPGVISVDDRISIVASL